MACQCMIVRWYYTWKYIISKGYMYRDSLLDVIYEPILNCIINLGIFMSGNGNWVRIVVHTVILLCLWYMYATVMYFNQLYLVPEHSMQAKSYE